MKIREMKDCIDRMQKIYKFDDSAEINLSGDLRTLIRDIVAIDVFDKETNVEISLRAKIRSDAYEDKP